MGQPSVPVTGEDLCGDFGTALSPVCAPSAPWDPLGLGVGVSNTPCAASPSKLADASRRPAVGESSPSAAAAAATLASVRRAARALPRFSLKPVSEWVQDDVVTHCVSCHAAFSIFNRKHHCRVCGHIFCHFCSAKTLPMPAPSYESVRVCDNCHADHQLAIVKNDFERKVENARDRGALACLSREVMERVLAFLPAPWLVHVAPLVSRDFYFLARSNALWKPLYEARWRGLPVNPQQTNSRETNWVFYQTYQRQHLSDAVMSNSRLRMRIQTLLTGSLKFFLIGASGVGKTCLLHRFLTGEYRRQPSGTVGVAVRTRPVQVTVGDPALSSPRCPPVSLTLAGATPAGPVTNLVFYDASGDPRYEALLPLYYVGVQVACVFFDLTAPETLEVCAHWCRALQATLPPDVVIAICGLKGDAAHRKVDAHTLAQFPVRPDVRFECSALADRGVGSFFEACVTACVQKIVQSPSAAVPPPPNSTPVDILSNGKWQW
eukprot:EG_transcript_10722